MKHTKRSAGSLGGRATVARHGSEHMQEIGARGAAATWERYHLAPIGQSGWAMVHRETNEVKAFINYIPDKGRRP
jgi:general stress protein YciG